MPGTASSPLHSRTTAKARPSAATRAANLIANTPVLFRLPAIQQLSPQVKTAPAVVTEVDAPVSELATNVAPQLSTVDLGARNIAAQSAAYETAPQGIAAQGTAAQGTAASIKPAEIKIESGARSWWEHWSSGIVLIILLIALATASALAFRGTDSSNTQKYIAETDKTQAVSSAALSNLSHIEVPTMAMSKDSATTQHIPRENLTVTLAPIGNPIPANQTERQSASPAPNRVGIGTVESKNRVSAVDSLVLSVDSQGKAAGSSANPATSIVSEPVHLPHATASLDPPIGVQPPQLFNESIAPRTGNIQATPASTGTTSPSSGNSPSLYDNSSTVVGKPTSSELGLDLSHDSQSLTPSDSLAVPAPAVTGNPATSVPARLISEQNTVPSQVSNQNPLDPSVRSTATPEFNREQLLKVYQEYTREPAAGQNRYRQPTPGVSATNISGAPQSYPPASTTTATNPALQNPGFQNPGFQNPGFQNPGMQAGTNQQLVPSYPPQQPLNGTTQTYSPQQSTGPNYNANTNGVMNTASGYGTQNPSTYR